MEEKKRCCHCMELKSVRANVCPYCGYDEKTPYDANYAPPGTEINGRYMLGVKIGHNSEGANYIGYSSAIGCKVLIREYMPVGLCKRIRGRATISVYPNKLVQYKTLMAEFTELNKNLAQMRNLPHIIPTLDIFEANNTTYVAYEYLEGIKLVEYLKDNAGELTWKQVSELFPTFFTTLSLMHNHNVVHRAISPDTIYVTPKGELRLCGFSIYAVRTVHLELPSELFHGYAAPEQYTPGAKQGTFTDVYAVCAVLYRILTGCKPPDAMSRIESDNLREPYEMNPNISRSVSRAIIKGLCLDSTERTQTITELVTQLFEQPEGQSVTMHSIILPAETENRNRKQIVTRKVGNADSGSDSKNQNSQNSENMIERVRTPLMFVIMLLCVLLIILIIVFSMMRSGSVTIQNQDSESTTTTDALSESENNIITESDTESPELTEPSGDSQMPTLIGTSYELQKEKLEADGWLYLEPVYEYNDLYKAGIIISQTINAGEPFQSGSTVGVTVSRGPASVVLPDYQGKSLMQYELELEELGLTSANYYTEAVQNYDFANGQVVELSKAAGEVFDLSGEEKLRIFYASNPETTIVVMTETIPPETAPPETEPVTEPVTESPTAPPETTFPDIQTAPIPEEPTQPNNDPDTDMQDAPQTAPIDIIPFDNNN
ncbi:MAG: PASTA domain-containing protein [Oscillospiraceae bacterium]|nr:PASTA domain-containing protein [Oscillospiraceae bacterium]